MEFCGGEWVENGDAYKWKFKVTKSYQKFFSELLLVDF